jgi:hypothetical protein
MVLRVCKRKFLITTLVFSFNESRAFTTIIKSAALQLSANAQTVKGTQEVVLDRERRGMAHANSGNLRAVIGLNLCVPGSYR